MLPRAQRPASCVKGQVEGLRAATFIRRSREVRAAALTPLRASSAIILYDDGTSKHPRLVNMLKGPEHCAGERPTAWCALQ